MTVLERARALEPPAAGRGEDAGLRRLWRLPLWTHLVALAVVLLALVPVIGTNASFSADEGAAITQARSLAKGDGWIVEHPVPDADPAGRHYPLELSERGTKGTAPFGKHPLYALALAGVDRLAGVAGMVLLSVVGTLAAAGLAAAIAGHLDPTLRRPTLWVVGVASPLLFDSYLVIAHTLGAAFAAASVLLAIVAIERQKVLAAVAVAPCVAVAVLLRTEASLFGLALAAVAGVIALRQGWRRWWPSLTVALSAAGAALSARLLERAWGWHLVGDAVASTVPHRDDAYGFLDGRLHAFIQTWIGSSYYGPAGLDAALMVMAAAIAIGALLVRRDPHERRGIALCASLAAVAAVTALLIAPRTVVPGLLVAFPLGLAGLLLLGRESVRTRPARLLAATFTLFSLGVIATQHANGGTAEWGGRYFAIGLPLLVPVGLLALRHHRERIGPRAARAAVTGLAVASLALAVMGVSSLRAVHRVTADLMTAVDRAGQAISAPGERPVMVAVNGAIPRLAWATYDNQRWLLAPPEELPTVLEGLRSVGVARLVLVTPDLERDKVALGPSVHVESEQPSPRRAWHLVVLRIE